jgi:two-component system, chemotaxis family, CheB/CheR fusion protein
LSAKLEQLDRANSDLKNLFDRTRVDAEGFQDVFLGRIHAFTAAYTLLSRDGRSPIPVRAILLEELNPFMAGERVNVVLAGLDVLPEPRAALEIEMAMAVHELTTNAVKYGALSIPEGTIGVGWSIENDGNDEHLVVQWIERNGPPVATPSRSSFGIDAERAGFRA